MKACDVAIVGIGAIGSLIAYALNLQGIKPLLVFKDKDQVKSFVKSRYKLMLANDVEVVLEGHPVTYENLPENIDVIFICTKAYDFNNALDSTLSKLTSFRLIITCQNGLGSYEYAKKVVGSSKVASLVLNHGVYRVSTNTFKYVGGGISYLGQEGGRVNDLLRDVASMLKFLNVKLVSDITPYRWLKLLVNAGINPITAILRERNEVILKNPYAKNLAFKAVKEGLILANTLNIKLPEDPISALIKVAQLTKDNYSSMLQDLISKGKTEVDYINGAIVRKAREYGIDAKVNEVLYLMVKALETSPSKSTNLKYSCNQL
ncbi:MAG: 2-dehydropantoate 2-reductase [Thermoprotei archaeon]|nr:MAG: 2-dehydropantoate 2-reductase [Thermoprotei archaeon]